MSEPETVEPPCGCECHKPTQQQKCADLARARGIPESEWPRKCFVEKHQMDDDGGNAWCYTCGMMADDSERVPPNPYKSAADKDALVAWMAADDARWHRYFLVLEKLVDTPSERLRQSHTRGLFYAILRSFVTAPVETIADAAWLVIQEKTK